MIYAKITNGEVEFSAATIYHFVVHGFLDNANASADELSAAGIVEVTRVNGQPPRNEFHHDLEIVQQEDGTWAETWVQIETSEWSTQANIGKASKSIIAIRNKFLEQSDWTQLPDNSLQNKSDWAVYRQALRDIPAQSGFPFNINWPTRP